jgi:hypothetical protein
MVCPTTRPWMQSPSICAGKQHAGCRSRQWRDPRRCHRGRPRRGSDIWSFFVSYCDPLTCGDASCLTSCHLAGVVIAELGHAHRFATPPDGGALTRLRELVHGVWSRTMRDKFPCNERAIAVRRETLTEGSLNDASHLHFPRQPSRPRGRRGSGLAGIHCAASG